MPQKKPNSLRLVPPAKPAPKTLREKLHGMRWRLINSFGAEPDPDLFDVLHAARCDPELTAKMAKVVRAQRRKNATRSKELDGLMAWLDGWDGSQATAARVASDLIFEIDVQVDEE